jgi:branched-chain amino acid transport system ATP-binding protein
MNDALLSVTGVDSGYGDVEVLRGVSLEVRAGEVVSVIGANGAGKTTMLSTIAGLIRPTAGSILFDGVEVSGITAHRLVERRVVMVPEGRRLFPGLTVQENLILGGYSRAARRQRAARLTEVFDLFPRLKERRTQEAGSLSGGEQQMCAIARGVMSDPKLMLLDEPSLGLAPVIVEQLFGLIPRLQERGVTLLMVEQNVLDALEMSDRGYVLERGAITMSNTGIDLLADERIQAAYLGA